MTEPAFSAITALQGMAPEAQIDALRTLGAERFDPVGFRFIEALARRAAARRAEAASALDGKLGMALAEFGKRFEHAGREARDAFARGEERFPEAAAELRQHCETGDFGALHRTLARLEAHSGSGPLAQLLAYIAHHGPEGASGDRPAQAAGVMTEPPGELKSIKYFRSTWSKLSVDRQLALALAQAPENAGPLNPHFLALQSLKLMRELSPAYLEQFLSYIDALQWLEQADTGRSPPPKNAARGETGRKRRVASDAPLNRGR